jgi:hypothetical protein
MNKRLKDIFQEITMAESRFVYVTYIRTTPEKLWDALIEPEFTRKYWAGCYHESSWKPGSAWKLMIPDGRVGDSGEVLEIDRPGSKLIEAVSKGWPSLLASLKSLLETGESLVHTRNWPKGH